MRPFDHGCLYRPLKSHFSTFYTVYDFRYRSSLFGYFLHFNSEMPVGVNSPHPTSSHFCDWQQRFGRVPSCSSLHVFKKIFSTKSCVFMIYQHFETLMAQSQAACGRSSRKPKHFCKFKPPWILRPGDTNYTFSLGMCTFKQNLTHKNNTFQYRRTSEGWVALSVWPVGVIRSEG